jgi:hypothetical protein
MHRRSESRRSEARGAPGGGAKQYGCVALPGGRCTAGRYCLSLSPVFARQRRAAATFPQFTPRPFPPARGGAVLRPARAQAPRGLRGTSSALALRRRETHLFVCRHRSRLSRASPLQLDIERHARRRPRRPAHTACATCTCGTPPPPNGAAATWVPPAGACLVRPLLMMIGSLGSLWRLYWLCVLPLPTPTQQKAASFRHPTTRWGVRGGLAAGG